MAKSSQTKLIGHTIAYTVLRLYLEMGDRRFTAPQIRARYSIAVCELAEKVGSNLHLGAKFDTAYISRGDRGVGKYEILFPAETNEFVLSEKYAAIAESLVEWIPEHIREFLYAKLGTVLSLSNAESRRVLSEHPDDFIGFLKNRFEINDAGTSFEIASFAVLKVYLEKFSCRLYRDTRTFAHEGGTDLSTDYGAVYQIKKLKISQTHQVDMLDAEVRKNFDADRIREGRVVLIIDNITPECKTYLLAKGSLKYFGKNDLLEIGSLLHDPEDRQKALRIIYEEFAREYANDICSRNNCAGMVCPILGRRIREN